MVHGGSIPYKSLFAPNEIRFNPCQKTLLYSMSKKNVTPILKCYNFSENEDIFNRFVLSDVEFKCIYIRIYKH